MGFTADFHNNSCQMRLPSTGFLLEIAKCACPVTIPIWRSDLSISIPQEPALFIRWAVTYANVYTSSPLITFIPLSKSN